MPEESTLHGPEDAPFQDLFPDDAKLARMEALLHVPRGVFTSLRNDGTDWEFAIKLVVLLEAALGAVLASRLQDEAVKGHCERLGLDGGRTSKLTLARDLGVLQEDAMRAFQELARIRNAYAHRVENIASDLQSFGSALPPSQRVPLVRALLHVPRDIDVDPNFLWGEAESIPRYLRLYMWVAGSLIMTALADQDHQAEQVAARKRELELAAKAPRPSEFSLASMFQSPRSTLLTASPEELRELLRPPGSPT
jgi:hypothetical protein